MDTLLIYLNRKATIRMFLVQTVNGVRTTLNAAPSCRAMEIYGAIIIGWKLDPMSRQEILANQKILFTYCKTADLSDVISDISYDPKTHELPALFAVFKKDTSMPSTRTEQDMDGSVRRPREPQSRPNRTWHTSWARRSRIFSASKH